MQLIQGALVVIHQVIDVPLVDVELVREGKKTLGNPISPVVRKGISLAQYFPFKVHLHQFVFLALSGICDRVYFPLGELDSEKSGVMVKSRLFNSYNPMF